MWVTATDITRHIYECDSHHLAAYENAITVLKQGKARVRTYSIRNTLSATYTVIHYLLDAHA